MFVDQPIDCLVAEFTNSLASSFQGVIIIFAFHFEEMSVDQTDVLGEFFFRGHSSQVGEILMLFLNQSLKKRTNCLLKISTENASNKKVLEIK